MLGRRDLVVVFGGVAAMIAVVGYCDPPPRSTAVPSPTPSVSSRQSLAEYAGGQTLQRSPSADKKSIIITDENLRDWASGKELTAVTRKTSKSPGPGFDLETEAPRVVWRDRVQQRLGVIHDLESETSGLESEIAGLWKLFYACDDPDERDQRLRPRLKQRIARQRKLSVELEAARVDLQKLLAEARRNGALPGWFRDLVK